MYLEEGVVKEQKGDSLIVETNATTGCHSCEAKGSCMVAAEGKMRQLRIKNTLNAQVGDRVSFEITETGVVTASVILYLLPVIFLFIGIFVGINLKDVLSMESDLSGGLGGFVGVLLSFVLIKIISLFTDDKKIFAPQLVEIISKKAQG